MTSTGTIYTIGHSQRSIENLLASIHAAQVACIVDVRAVPLSTRYPHFNQDILRAALNEAQVIYHWAGRALGGRRNAQPGSPHIALQDFARGFADHMGTPEFERGLAQLLNLAQRSPVAILCAERLPENCHRRLICDALLLRGMRVVHLIDVEQQYDHALSPELRCESTALIYDRNKTKSLNLQ